MKNVERILASKGTTVHTITPTDTVFAALEQMAANGIGALVVLDKGDVVGVLSERDYARKVILQGKASKDTPVREIMETELVSVDTQATVAECMELMSERRVRHLPVIENGRLAGMISIGDVVKAIIDEQASTIEDLEKYITGRP